MNTIKPTKPTNSLEKQWTKIDKYTHIYNNIYACVPHITCIYKHISYSFIYLFIFLVFLLLHVFSVYTMCECLQTDDTAATLWHKQRKRDRRCSSDTILYIYIWLMHGMLLSYYIGIHKQQSTYEYNIYTYISSYIYIERERYDNISLVLFFFQCYLFCCSLSIPLGLFIDVCCLRNSVVWISTQTHTSHGHTRTRVHAYISHDREKNT